MSQPKAVGVIQLAILCIKDDNVDKLQQVLNVMPLDQLKDQADALLSTFLDVCAAYDRKEAADIILKAWEVVYPDVETIPLKSRLFLMNKIKLPTLSFVTLMSDDYMYIELMDDLMAADNSEEVISACAKADRIFGPQSYDTYKIIADSAEEAENYMVYNYAVANMEQVAPYAPIPEWVNNYIDGPVPKESDLVLPDETFVFDLPSNEEAVDLLTAGLDQLGVSLSDIENARIFLLNKLDMMSDEEKRELLRPVMENQADQTLDRNTYLLRVLGPSNPLVNQDLSLNNINSKYGGCRMFITDVFDFNEEFDYVEPWFEGVCNQCHLRIRHHWHAVRVPRPHGGWVGCYCDWDCARQSIFENGEEPDLLTHELITIFENEMKTIGIQERLAN